MISCRLDKDANTVGLWNFFDSAIDYSGNGKTITLGGTPSYEMGQLGKKINLSQNSYGEWPVATNYGKQTKCTLEYIIERPDPDSFDGTYPRLFTSGDGGGYSWPDAQFYIASSYSVTWLRWRYDVSGNWTYFSGGLPIYSTDYPIFYVVIAWDDNVPYGYIWVNGILQKDWATGKMAILQSATTKERISKIGNANYSYIYGGELKIYRIRISNTLRKPEELLHNWLRLPQILNA